MEKAAELENADKRQPAEPYVVPRKHIQLVIKRPTSPAKPEAAEAGSKFEEAWKAFDALGRKHQLRFIHDACLHVGFDPLKMAPRAEFGLADEEPELAEDRPADVVPAIDGDPVVQPEEWDDAADTGVENLQDRDDDLSEAADAEARGAVDAPAGVAPATHDAAAAQAEQRDDAAGLGAEDVQDADDDASEVPSRRIVAPRTCRVPTTMFPRRPSSNPATRRSAPTAVWNSRASTRPR